MANKFKVGDRVTQNYLGKPNPATVVKVEGSTVTYIVDGDDATCWDVEDNLDPAPPEEPELESLVRKANEGEEAQRTIAQKYPEQVEIFLPEDDQWEPLDAENTIYKYRIKQKPKPTFPEMTVGGGWKVETTDERTVKIGCEYFDKRNLIAALIALCRNGEHSFSDGGTIFILKATKEGIRDRKSNAISWADADRLLHALESYQEELKKCA